MDTSFFSIITVVLNDCEGFSRTRDSVREQTFADWEWIVVDGGSTDGTLENIASLSDERCVWISERDTGIYDAMNKGLHGAKGDYLIFMNAGDEFAGSDVLRKVNQSVIESDMAADLVFGDSCERTIGNRVLVKPARPATTVTYGMFTHHQAMFYRRAAVSGLRFDASFFIAGDYEFTCRLLLLGATNLRVHFPVCIFSRGGVSATRAAIGRREVLRVQQSVLGLSWLRRMRNYFSFLSSNILRSYMPGTYDRIRFR